MDKDFVVGIDIGGQSCKLGVVDARGEVLAQSVIKTNDNPDADVIIKELAEAVIKLVAQAGKHGQIRGIGVGAPNGNYYTGSIASSLGRPRRSQVRTETLRGLRRHSRIAYQRCKCGGSRRDDIRRRQGYEELHNDYSRHRRRIRYRGER